MYAQRIVADFEAGTIPLSEGTKLGSFLCSILNCSPSRLSKKLKIGKKYFQRCPPRPEGSEYVAKHVEHQRRLSEMEEMFLMAESQTNRGMANTQVLSERIQTEWRERFIGHAHTVNQKLKNAWDWNTGRRQLSLTSGAINKLLSSITPQKMDTGINQLAPLFLVTHNPDASINALNSGDLSTAMGNMMSSWQQGAQHAFKLFSQPHQTPQAQALASVASSAIRGHADTRSPPASIWDRARFQLSREGGGEDRDRGASGGRAGCRRGTDGRGSGSSHVLGQQQGRHVRVNSVWVLGDELWLSLSENLTNLGYQNSVAMEARALTLFNAPPDFFFFLFGGGQARGASLEGEGGGKGEKKGSKAPDGVTHPYYGTHAPPPSPPWWQNTFSRSGEATFESERPGLPEQQQQQQQLLGGQGQVNLTGGGDGKEGRGGGGGAGGGGGTGSSGGDRGTSAEADGKNEGEVESAGTPEANEDESHRFEDFIGEFLSQVPFEAVDVWVPLSNQDQKDGEDVVLFHAGYFTNTRELEEWGEYSTNFSFQQGQGLPGRVYGSNKSEWQEDVGLLGQKIFLRLLGAVEMGIKTTFGVPVVSRCGVTFVIVFYSRATMQVNSGLKEFIEHTVKAWKFDATLDSDTGGRAPVPSGANP
ncbi:unnamed protein product [Discosporangium mesarthrocarpum]